MATLSDIEKYRMTNGRYDVAAIERDLNPAADPLSQVFATFFGATDDDGGPAAENELIALARSENERLATEDNTRAATEGRELLTGLDAATGSDRNRTWQRLVELGFAELTGDAEELEYQLTEAGQALHGYRPLPDPYADQAGTEEEPGRPGSWGGSRPGAGRPRAEQHQQGLRLWVPYQDEAEAARLRSVSPETRRQRLLNINNEKGTEMTRKLFTTDDLLERFAPNCTALDLMKLGGPAVLAQITEQIAAEPSNGLEDEYDATAAAEKLMDWARTSLTAAVYDEAYSDLDDKTHRRDTLPEIESWLVDGDLADAESIESLAAEWLEREREADEAAGL